MEWETPEVTEIRMDAEINAYQDEGGGNVPIARPAEAAAEDTE